MRTSITSKNFIKSSLLTLMAGAAIIAQNADASDQINRLSAEQVKSDIALAEDAYKRIHPGYTRYTTAAEMARAWDELEQLAIRTNGLTLAQFYLGVQDVLTRIRCDHSKAELPQALIEARQTSPVYLPIRWSVIEGRGFVRTALPNSGLEYGDEILAIDNQPLSEMIADVASYIPVDGYTEWSRTSGISESLEFRGGAVDHFGALLWDIRPEAKLKIRTAADEIRNVTIDRVDFKAWSALGAAGGEVKNFKDAIRFERLGDNGAYLAVDTFVNYRDPVDPDTLYGPIFDALKAENREYLIVDLRRNGGGSDDAQHGLMNRLLTDKKDFSRDVRVNTLDFEDLKPHLWTWDKRAMNPKRIGFKKNKDGTYSLRKILGQHGKIKPAKNAFAGKLIVLTSHSNSSGSTALLAHLKDSGRATLIGEKTGGSAEGTTAGILFTLTLPESGIKTRLPMFRYFYNIETFEPGLGVSPDIYVPMTVEAFRERRDPALETAISVIGK